MSGHSKWNNIKRKKEKTDAQKAKIFTKIGREMAIVVREGGPDPENNSKLRDCIAKAKANNVPNDNIDRIIKKAAGEGDGREYEEITYEGYGPEGVAVVVETLTDNRNRTAGDLRHYFDKNGGNLGQPGSVMFMFNRTGMLRIAAEGLSEDTVMEDALDAGASDFNSDGEVFDFHRAQRSRNGSRRSRRQGLFLCFGRGGIHSHHRRQHFRRGQRCQNAAPYRHAGGKRRHSGRLAQLGKHARIIFDKKLLRS